MNGGDYAGGYGPANTGSTTNLKMGWGTSGKLATGNTSKMVTLQADFPISETYTIEFAKTNNPASNNPIFAEALITWSVEGNYVTRRVNIGDGVSVSGVSQSVRVVMTDATTNQNGPPNGAEYSVSCQVTRGVRATTTQGPTLVPQMTTPANTGGVGNGAAGAFFVAAHSQVSISIPQDAGIVSIYVTAFDLTTNSNAAGALTVTQGYGANPVKAYDSFLYDDWVPISPGTDTITLANFTGDNYFVSVTFGCDG